MAETKIPNATEAFKLSENPNSRENILFEDCKMKILKSIYNGNKYEVCNRSMGIANMQKLTDQGYGVFDRSNGDIEVYWFADGQPSFMQLPPIMGSKELLKIECGREDIAIVVPNKCIEEVIRRDKKTWNEYVNTLPWKK